MLRIKEICKEKGLTVSDVAQKLGILQPSLSRIINGYNTTTDTLQKIADVLEVQIPDLFYQSPKEFIHCPYCGGKIKVSKE